MGTCASAVQEPESFSVVLPNTEDLAVGSVPSLVLHDVQGAVRRHKAALKELEKSYSPEVNTLLDNFMLGCALILTCRYAYKLDPHANFVGWRPIVNGEAQPYTFLEFVLLVVRYPKLRGVEEANRCL